MSEYKVKGIRSDLEVFKDKLTLTPKGLLGWGDATRTIPFTSITSIQHKKAGLQSGYLNFTLPGGVQSGLGTLKVFGDPNTFVYTKKSDDNLIEEIKIYIEKQIRELKAAEATSVKSSVADELAKLVKFKEQGILTDEEFAKAKQRLLGGV
jgi:hypothetical protein